jgi:hypothetical protein
MSPPHAARLAHGMMLNLNRQRALLPRFPPPPPEPSTSLRPSFAPRNTAPAHVRQPCAERQLTPANEALTWMWEIEMPHAIPKHRRCQQAGWRRQRKSVNCRQREAQATSARGSPRYHFAAANSTPPRLLHASRRSGWRQACLYALRPPTGRVHVASPWLVLEATVSIVAIQKLTGSFTSPQRLSPHLPSRMI